MANIPEHLAKISTQEEKDFTEGIKKLVFVISNSYCVIVESLSSDHRVNHEECRGAINEKGLFFVPAVDVVY